MKLIQLFAVVLFALFLTACGQRVEVPPAHVAKIMTKDGYQEGVIGTSKFRYLHAGLTVISWLC